MVRMSTRMLVSVRFLTLPFYFSLNITLLNDGKNFKRNQSYRVQQLARPHRRAPRRLRKEKHLPPPPSALLAQGQRGTIRGEPWYGLVHGGGTVGGEARPGLGGGEAGKEGVAHVGGGPVGELLGGGMVRRVCGGGFRGRDGVKV